jgi:hypothetical protein
VFHENDKDFQRKWVVCWIILMASCALLLEMCR